MSSIGGWFIISASPLGLGYWVVPNPNTNSSGYTMHTDRLNVASNYIHLSQRFLIFNNKIVCSMGGCALRFCLVLKRGNS